MKKIETINPDRGEKDVVDKTLLAIETAISQSESAICKNPDALVLITDFTYGILKQLQERSGGRWRTVNTVITDYKDEHRVERVATIVRVNQTQIFNMNQEASAYHAGLKNPPVLKSELTRGIKGIFEKSLRLLQSGKVTS